MSGAARPGEGEGEPSRIEYLTEMPTPASVYAAAVGRSARAVVRSSIEPRPVVPDLALRTGPVALEAARADAYCRLIGETPREGAAPPGLVHVAAFGLQLALLARPDFPLPMLGLVHLANRVERLEAGIGRGFLRGHHVGAAPRCAAPVRRRGRHPGGSRHRIPAHG